MSARQQHCQLYLTLPHDPGADAPIVLDALLSAHQIGCVLLRSSPEGGIGRQLGSELRDVADGHETAFLVENDLQAARELEADGLHIGADPELLTRARALFVPDFQIGVHCGLQRHQAMQMGEMGADYVAFGEERAAPADAVSQPVCELIDWWAEIFVVPCVAWGIGTVEQGLAYADHGAEFVALHEDLWFRPEALADVITELTASLGGALDAA